MARYFFELSHGGDTYHDAQGKELRGLKEAKERAFDIAHRMLATAEAGDILCTVRDITGKELMHIRVGFGLTEGAAGAAGDSGGNGRTGLRGRLWPAKITLCPH